MRKETDVRECHTAFASQMMVCASYRSRVHAHRLFEVGMSVWDVGLGFGICALSFGPWDLSFGPWDLGFGPWDLGFGIWDLGFDRVVPPG